MSVVVGQSRLAAASSASLPQFLIVGAAKAGTTALYAYLKQHPQIFLAPEKETNFFAFEGERPEFQGPGDDWINHSSLIDLESYAAHFADAPEGALIGEACPWYLYHPEAARRIRRQIPDARIVMILRNPADRAFSSYLYLRGQLREPIHSFQCALDAEEERIAANWEYIWHYRRAGLYCDQVARYFDRFDRDRILVLLYEDLVESSIGVVREIFRFVGVDPGFAPRTSARPKRSGVPRNVALQKLVLRDNRLRSMLRPMVPRRLRKSLRIAVSERNLVKPHLDPQVRARLAAGFRADIEKLAMLIDRDLSHWM